MHILNKYIRYLRVIQKIICFLNQFFNMPRILICIVFSMMRVICSLYLRYPKATFNILFIIEFMV